MVGDLGRGRTSYIKNMIPDAGLTCYNKLKRLIGNIDEWRKYEKLRNQPHEWAQKNKIIITRKVNWYTLDTIKKKKCNSYKIDDQHTN